MPPPTDKQRLARLKLGRDLAEWVAEQRHPFPDVTRSWENVARQLDKATDGEVSVTGEIIRKWNRAWSPAESEVGAA